MASNLVNAYEATCSALWRFKFRPIAETIDDTGAMSQWFTRGERPRDVRVEVNRSGLGEILRVAIEFRNHGMKGVKVCQVNCGPGHSQAAISQGVENAVRVCLEVFRDVLEGTGVASAQQLNSTPKTTEST